jgi:hypothetical protein
MRHRIFNEAGVPYHHYGGRGISIAEEWLDYENFRKWSLANGYDDTLTLDRINNDGDYCPENCRWATMKTQGNNRRTVRKFTYEGETKTLKQWAEDSRCTVSYHTLYQRIVRLNWEFSKAFETASQRP